MGNSGFLIMAELATRLNKRNSINLSLVTELNPESRFFIDWHPQNIFALKCASSNNQFTQLETDTSPQQINTNNIQ